MAPQVLEMPATINDAQTCFYIILFITFSFLSISSSLSRCLLTSSCKDHKLRKETDLFASIALGRVLTLKFRPKKC